MMPRKTNKPSAEKTVRDIRRATRRRYSAEEKIRIVLEGIIGIRGEVDMTEHWYLSYGLDGGTGQSGFTWQALAAFGYQLNRLDLIFGLRYLSWNFSDGDPGAGLLADFQLRGPYAGLKFKF